MYTEFYPDLVDQVIVLYDDLARGLKYGDVINRRAWVIAYDNLETGEAICLGPYFARKQDAERAIDALTKAGWTPEFAEHETDEQAWKRRQIIAEAMAW